MQLGIFLGVVSTVSHMAKMCALRLSPNTLYFIMNDTAAEGGATVWCEVNQVELSKAYLKAMSVLPFQLNFFYQLAIKLYLVLIFLAHIIIVLPVVVLPARKF